MIDETASAQFLGYCRDQLGLSDNIACSVTANFLCNGTTGCLVPALLGNLQTPDI